MTDEAVPFNSIDVILEASRNGEDINGDGDFWFWDAAQTEGNADEDWGVRE